RHARLSAGPVLEQCDNSLVRLEVAVGCEVVLLQPSAETDRVADVSAQNANRIRRDFDYDVGVTWVVGMVLGVGEAVVVAAAVALDDVTERGPFFRDAVAPV